MSTATSEVSQLSPLVDPPLQPQAGISISNYDAFISYSRRNEAFASKLARALESYKPPKFLGVPQRYLNVFRDKEDFTAGEYRQKLEHSLKNSSKLIVICSPEARKSQYVNEEIRLFAQVTGADHIIPILLAGVPNNEAKTEQEEHLAFPEALCEVMPLPLAVNYLDFDAAKDKVDKGVYWSSWCTILANLYEMSRSEVEQREHKRKVRTRRIAYSVMTGSILVLSSLLFWALISRNEAKQQKETAQRQRKIAEEQLERNGQLLYVANMRLAQQAFKSGDIAQGQELLEGYVHRQQELRGFEWYYLWALYHDEQTTLRGYTSTIDRVAFSPDGRTLATGGANETVRRRNEATKQETATLRGSMVSSIAFSPDGNTLATGGFLNDIVTLWDTLTGQELATLKGRDFFITDLAFSPDGKTLAASGGSDNWHGAVMLWDTATKRLVTIWGYDDDLDSIAFSPDGKTLATGGGHGAVTLWDTVKEEMVTLKERSIGRGYAVDSVAFSPDGRMLAAGSDDKTVRLWNVTTKQETATLRMHADYGGSVEFTPSVAFSPDGKTLASCGWDKTVRLWDVATGRELATLKGHTDWVKSVAFSPDGRTLATGSNDKSVKLWDTAARRELINLEDYEGMGGVMSMALSPDGKTVATGHTFDMAVLWDTTTKQELARLQATSTVDSMAFSPDGKTLVTSSGDKTVKLWNTVTGQELITLNEQAGFEYVQSVAFSPDGKMLAIGGTAGTGAVMLWDTTIRQEFATLRVHARSINSVAFSPDGRMLAAGTGGDNEAAAVVLWDTTTRQEVAALTLRGDDVLESNVAFSPDGKFLAAGSFDGMVTLWDTVTWRELATLKGHGFRISSVAFSPDGKTLATGSADKAVRMWNIATRQEITTVVEKDTSDDRGDFPSWVAFSPDGKTLIIGSSLTIKLCNTATDEEVKVQLNITD